MSHRIPLGKKEGSRLEFKGSEALRAPETIARGVVSMLNADGGEVWVGLREENERAVAIEPIVEPDQAKRRLLDHLIDAIEPAPSKEIEVEPEASDEGFVLRIVTQPRAGRRPYALLKGGGRQFLIRVGPRSRPMTREELQESFSHGGSRSPSRDDRALDEAKSRLADGREQGQRAGGRRLWLRLEPSADLALDRQDPRLETLLQDPLATGNRRSGWSFVVQFGPGPRLQKDRLVMTDESYDAPYGRIITLQRRGALTFEAPLEALFWKGEEGEIWPFALLEYPISAFRIARAIYAGKLPFGTRVVADLSLFGIRGWKLRPHSPVTWLRGRPRPFEESEDLVSDGPLDFSAEEIENDPDRCGYRLVERVYEAFGYRRDEMPAEFDTQSGRLILPE
jgi:hypothetical protein